jgi:hypothetical protein
MGQQLMSIVKQEQDLISRIINKGFKYLQQWCVGYVCHILWLYQMALTAKSCRQILLKYLNVF